MGPPFVSKRAHPFEPVRLFETSVIDRRSDLHTNVEHINLSESCQITFGNFVETSMKFHMKLLEVSLV